jgi:hypothetical protein
MSAPDTSHWFHKIANVLGALLKSAHPGAKKALAEIWNAEDKDHARTAVKAFAAAYGPIESTLPPSGCGRRSPRATGRRRPGWRWPSS